MLSTAGISGSPAIPLSFSVYQESSQGLLLKTTLSKWQDPTWETRYPGKSTCAIVTLCNWDWFKKWEKDGTLRARGDDYTELKVIRAMKVAMD